MGGKEGRENGEEWEGGTEEGRERRREMASEGGTNCHWPADSARSLILESQQCCQHPLEDSTPPVGGVCSGAEVANWLPYQETTS